MAHTDSIEKILVQSTREMVVRYYPVTIDGATRYARATPMGMIWPAGDPIPRDQETLVEWITEDEYRSAITLEA